MFLLRVEFPRVVEESSGKHITINLLNVCTQGENILTRNHFRDSQATPLSYIHCNRPLPVQGQVCLSALS